MSYTLRATIKVLIITLEFILLVIQVWNMTKHGPQSATLYVLCPTLIVLLTVAVFALGGGQ